MYIWWVTIHNCYPSKAYSRVSNKNIVSNKAWSLTKKLVYYIKLKDFSDFWPIFSSKQIMVVPPLFDTLVSRVPSGYFCTQGTTKSNSKLVSYSTADFATQCLKMDHFEMKTVRMIPIIGKTM